MRIFVGGLSFLTAEEKLRKAVEHILGRPIRDGEEVHIPSDAAGESKMYGFVETDEESFAKLRKSNGFMLDGRALRFEKAKAPKPRPVLSGGREW